MKLKQVKAKKAYAYDYAKMLKLDTSNLNVEEQETLEMMNDWKDGNISDKDFIEGAKWRLGMEDGKLTTDQAEKMLIKLLKPTASRSKAALTDDWVNQAIKQLSEVNKVLSDKLGIPVELEVTKNGDRTIDIDSKDLIKYVPQFLKPLFSKIWLTGYIKETDYGLWCPIHYNYEHTAGGSNGYELATAFYQKDNSKWVVKFATER